jgi:hypothetical protein
MTRGFGYPTILSNGGKPIDVARAAHGSGFA